MYGGLAVVGIVLAGLAVVFIGLVAAFIVLGVCLGIALLSVFGSIMMTRGSERELSDFHSQSLEPGQLLVAVDLPDDAAPERIAVADRVLRDDTSTTVSLPHES